MPNTQTFKAVYFADQKHLEPGSNFALAFNERNKDIYKTLANYTSNEIRELLGTDSYGELEQRANNESLPVNTYCLWYLRKIINNYNTATKTETIKSVGGISRFINKVFEADCLDILPKIPAKSIDMILCDLPYGTTQNHWDSVIPLDKLWQQYERIIKDNGVIALTSQGVFTANLILSNPRLFKYKITWIKSKSTNFLNAKKQPLRRHEDICIFYKSQPVYHPQMAPGEPYDKGYRKNQLTGSYGEFKTVKVKSKDGKRYPTDVVYFKTAESEGEVFHPTQKPVELGRYLIRTFTNKKDVVLDNTCGSGSFLVAASLESRKFIGIEKNQEVFLHRKHRVDYIEVCKKRLKKAQNQAKLV
jgi:site-specific DNA-methyltransferase (adenine-specific)/modification methylase